MNEVENVAQKLRATKQIEQIVLETNVDPTSCISQMLLLKAPQNKKVFLFIICAILRLHTEF